MFVGPNVTDFPPILTKLEFGQQIFSKTCQYKISRKAVEREPGCSTRSDVQTDAMKTTVANCKRFASTPD
jgi:hypothetical protein